MAWKSALGAVLYTIPILMSCLLVLDGTYSQDKSRRINKSFLKEQLAERQLEGLQLDRTKTEQLLSLVLPPSIVDKLRHCETSSFDSAANWIKSGTDPIPAALRQLTELEATVMFMDLSNYYELAAKLGSKRDTTVLLNMIFYEVDKVLRKFPEIERIKAVKTKLIFLGGLGSANHLQEMINFALDVRKTLSKKVLLEIPSDGNGGVKTLRASLKFAFGLQTGK
ncbi:hypothetical protein DFJ73DRAFT_757574 [Zopfochytrium polystomum]|nr:hypothetical protein DFJ73DRAFT_757574 [Zopfochytrium polystomum]